MAKQSKKTFILFGTLVLLACFFYVSVGAEGVMRLEGTPEEIGRQHGVLAKEQIRLMVSEYIGDELVNGKLNERAVSNRVSAWCNRVDFSNCTRVH